MGLRKQEKQRRVRIGKRKMRVARGTLNGQTPSGATTYWGSIGPGALTAGHQNGLLMASDSSSVTYHG
ncbi:MAG TPA: hypothetical protein VG013_36740 [Gemmataceae bacterium]|jgi:hypothetical protein|nr:hypothetical protein [Gemmataceae bacterium]